MMFHAQLVALSRKATKWRIDYQPLVHIYCKPMSYFALPFETRMPSDSHHEIIIQAVIVVTSERILEAMCVS